MTSNVQPLDRPDNDRREMPSEKFWMQKIGRILQVVAMYCPGPTGLRVRLHRWRGVRIGQRVYINQGVIIGPAYPHWVSIGSRVTIGIRAMLIPDQHTLAPWKSEHGRYVSIRIGDDVYVGPGVIILPNVTVGAGSVIAAGSVVTQSVPPLVLVQGNPARPIAKCTVPLRWEMSMKEFLRNLRPLDRQGS